MVWGNGGGGGTFTKTAHRLEVTNENNFSDTFSLSLIRQLRICLKEALKANLPKCSKQI